MRLHLIRFLIADGVGALVGTSIFFFLGYGLGSQFRDLIQAFEEEIISPYRPILLLALLGAIAGYLAYIFWKHPIPTGDPNEVPLIGGQIAAHMPHHEERVVTLPGVPSSQAITTEPPAAKDAG
jgi:hypothetical protein